MISRRVAYAAIVLICSLGVPTVRAVAEQAHAFTAFERALYEWRFADALVFAVDRLKTAVREHGHRSPEAAAAHHNIGVVFRLSGRKEWAVLQMQHALRLRRAVLGNDHPDVAQTLVQLSRTLRLFREAEEARERMQEARRIVGRSDPDGLSAAFVYHHMAMLRRRSDPAAADSLYRRAIDIRERRLGPRHPVTIETRCWYGHFLTDCNRFDEATTVLERCLADAARCGVGQPGIVSPASNSLGLVMLRAGERERAERLLLDAIARRDRVQSDTPRWFGMKRNGSGTHKALALFYLRHGREEDAWSILQRSLGWISDTIVSTGEPRHDEDLRQRLSDLERCARRLARRCRDRHGCEGASAHERTHLEYLKVLRAYVRRQGELSDAVSERRLDVSETLGDKEALIGWVSNDLVEYDGATTRRTGYAYVVRHARPVRWVQLIDTTDEREKDQWTTGRIRAGERLRLASMWPMRAGRDDHLIDDLNVVWKCLFRDIEPHLEGVNRLLVLADHLHTGVPVECMVDGEGRFLAERFAVTYIPSIAHVEPVRRNAADGIVVVGDTRPGAPPMPMDETLAPLVHAARETAEIAALYDRPAILSGDNASVETLRRRLAGGPVDALHIGAHAVVYQKDAELSMLALSASEGDTCSGGWVSTREVQLSWRLDANVVTLGACRSASGAGSFSDGPLGFHQSMLAAGGRQVVSSVWDAEDEAAAEFMVRFYRHYRALGDAAVALQKARLELRSLGRFAHPVYWGGFVVVGNAR